MRTSVSIRGALAVAVVTAGASWFGMGAAVAAAPCGEGRPTSLELPTGTLSFCESLGDLVASPEQARAARQGGDDRILGVEHIGRSSRLLSGPNAVAGLNELPAIVGSNGASNPLKGDLIYRVTGVRVLPGAQYGGRPGSSGMTASGDPDAPALSSTSGLPMLPITPQAPAGPATGSTVNAGPATVGTMNADRPGENAQPGEIGAGPVSAGIGKLPSLETGPSGLRVR